jgi:two-component system phosphate regulon sensor histidine kinase PhoR
MSSATNQASSGSAFSEDLRQYQQIVEALQEGILLLDGELRVHLFNPAALRILGAKATDVRGEGLESLVRHHELLKMVNLLVSKDVAMEETFILQGTPERRIKVYGKRVFARSKGTEGGQQVALMLVLSDVTQLHRLERIRRDFVGNVSHELKTPITSIKASVETLMDGALDDKEDAQTFVKMIGRQSDRLLEIVEDLLNLSRLQSESEGRSLVKAVCPVAELFLKVKDACEGTARAAGVSLEFEGQSKLDVYVNAGLMGQALMNLTENAIKSSAEGSTVRVRVACYESLVEFQVSDKGCGIAPAHLDRIFERFYRVDSGRGRDKGGSGLGLAIVKHIVQAHGGDISVESALGQGSTFSLRLPKSVPGRKVL